MCTNLNNLREVWERARDDEILKAITVDRANYEPDAIEVIHSVAERRGLHAEAFRKAWKQASTDIAMSSRKAGDVGRALGKAIASGRWSDVAESNCRKYVKFGLRAGIAPDDIARELEAMGLTREKALASVGRLPVDTVEHEIRYGRVRSIYNRVLKIGLGIVVIVHGFALLFNLYEPFLPWGDVLESAFYFLLGIILLFNLPWVVLKVPIMAGGLYLLWLLAGDVVRHRIDATETIDYVVVAVVIVLIEIWLALSLRKRKLPRNEKEAA